MKFQIEENIAKYIAQPVVGNVYNIRGGSGARLGRMFVIISIDRDMASTAGL